MIRAAIYCIIACASFGAPSGASCARGHHDGSRIKAEEPSQASIATQYMAHSARLRVANDAQRQKTGPLGAPSCDSSRAAALASGRRPVEPELRKLVRLGGARTREASRTQRSARRPAPPRGPLLLHYASPRRGCARRAQVGAILYVLGALGAQIAATRAKVLTCEYPREPLLATMCHRVSVCARARASDPMCRYVHLAASDQNAHSASTHTDKV